MKKTLLTIFLFLSFTGVAYAARKTIYIKGGRITTYQTPLNYGTLGGPGEATSTSGLVGYWPFDGKYMNWTSSTTGTAADASGNGNTGTLDNMNLLTSTVQGKIGQALRFNGVNQKITISSSASVLNQGTNPYSVSAWVYERNIADCPGGTDSCAVISSLGNGGSGNEGDFFLGLTQSGQVRFNNWRSSGSNINGYFTLATLNDNTWYFITAVYTGSSNLIYINGVNQTLSTPSGTGAGDTLGTYIGTLYTGLSSYFWNGSLDDVRIYNRALSATEINELYQLGFTTIIK